MFGFGKKQKVNVAKGEKQERRISLSIDELEFLSSHSLKEDDVFDASGYSHKQMKAASKEAGKKIILGTPCKKLGHRLKTRNSDCIQCTPSTISYSNRHHQTNWLYLAASPSLAVIKIGSSKDLIDRLSNLNGQTYGGAADWEMKYAVKINQVGIIEQEIHSTLKNKHFAGAYKKDGKMQSTREMFNVTIEDGIILIDRTIKNKGLTVIKNFTPPVF